MYYLSVDPWSKKKQVFETIKEFVDLGVQHFKQFQNYVVWVSRYQKNALMFDLDGKNATNKSLLFRGRVGQKFKILLKYFAHGFQTPSNNHCFIV